MPGKNLKTFISKPLSLSVPASFTEEEACAIVSQEFSFAEDLPPETRGLVLVSSNAGDRSAVAFWKQALNSGVAFALPAGFPWTLANATASYLSRCWQVKGPVSTLSGKGEALGIGLHYAMRYLHSGQAHAIMLVAAGYSEKPGFHRFEGFLVNCQEAQMGKTCRVELNPGQTLPDFSRFENPVEEALQWNHAIVQNRIFLVSVPAGPNLFLKPANHS